MGKMEKRIRDADGESTARASHESLPRDPPTLDSAGRDCGLDCDVAS
jgi:hypothetical protein